MRGRLGRGDKPRPDAHAVRSGRERHRHRLPGADATRRQHRQVDRRDHLAEQRHHRNRPTHMPACLDALRDDEVASRPGGRDRLLARPDLPASQRTASVRHLDKSTFRLAIEKFDDFRGARSDLDALQIKGRAHRRTSEEYRRHDEVHSERLVGERACPREEIGERGGSKPGPGGAQHPEGTSLRHRRRQFRRRARPMPACWIGTAQPTSSVNLVAIMVGSRVSPVFQLLSLSRAVRGRQLDRRRRRLYAAFNGTPT